MAGDGKTVDVPGIIDMERSSCQVKMQLIIGIVCGRGIR